jgi:cobalt/nickel transport protein
MMRNCFALTGAVLLSLTLAGTAAAHFGMVIPSENIVTQDKKSIELQLSFSHPFEMMGMDLVKPKQFMVVNDAQQTDLLDSLTETKVMDYAGWQTTYEVKRPGVYHFVMEPLPYWEPAEDVSIIHYTKTIVAAFGDDVGWDEPVGLPTEIVPLTRPFGNYAGNSFTGLVMMDGEPVPHAEVEVELYNRDLAYKAPSDYHVTQVVKADGAGVFSFTCPQSGWWGFAALNEADYTIKDPEGAEKGVELGAVLWIYLDPVNEQ